MKGLIAWLPGPTSLSLLFFVFSTALALALAPQVRNIEGAQVFFIVAWIWTFGSLESTAASRQTGRKLAVATVILAIAIGLAGLATFHWVDGLRDEAADNGVTFEIFQPILFDGEIKEGAKLRLIVNFVNQTKRIAKIRIGKDYAIIHTPKTNQERSQWEDYAWNRLEHDYINYGMDQDLPARKNTNLQIPTKPLTDAEARGLLDGSLTIYFFGVLRDRDTKKSALEVNVFKGMNREIQYGSKHNYP